ncbi:relaxase/mobilization nuclease domain-containing protein [Cohaesibacter gelatinilyticus]|uniref:Relaxase/Mobilisation nuclease domain-containing protein n=1 Tax=Cohaesibacter gelatinilyticus TaxID=372072 RepID=A0A285PFN2_9HYPH|nr:relaxase/mobilization nuclease domain-containing protein [Cohaesibacter gelatinilyticus]SNZ20093.1 Relaxase/Mobilisation nuclease domain-containing protein [Cohaesibacter gelatinilyticus]
MIIKSMARKAPTFGQLIGYIGRDAEDQEPFAHNLYHAGINTGWVEAQFQENYRKLPSRQNGNALYHEILALEPQPHLSSQQVSERLRNIAQVYCDARAPGHLVWGKTHHDTSFPHVHLMISSNAVNSDRRRRLTKKQFAEAQRATEIYAREHFPELNLKPVYARSSPVEIVKKPRSESEMERRTGEPSRKQIVAAMVRDCLSRSNSPEQLSLNLQEKGLCLHQRGQNWSIEDQQSTKRYRLRTLGLTTAFVNWRDRQAENKSPKPKRVNHIVKDPRRAELERLAVKRLKDFEREHEEDRER